MDAAAPHAAHPLSLQDKLDQISQDRTVLAVLRDLMRLGLHDGDPLQHGADGTRGRLKVLRGAEPRAIVRCDDGTEVPFRSGDWSRIG
jgi:hypothetical protein